MEEAVFKWDGWPEAGWDVTFLRRNHDDSSRNVAVYGKMSKDGSIRWRLASVYRSGEVQHLMLQRDIDSLMEEHANSVDFLVDQHGHRLRSGTYTIKDAPRMNPVRRSLYSSKYDRRASLEDFLRTHSMAMGEYAALARLRDLKGTVTVSRFGDFDSIRVGLPKRPSQEARALLRSLTSFGFDPATDVDDKRNILPMMSKDYAKRNPTRRNRLAQFCRGGF